MLDKAFYPKKLILMIQITWEMFIAQYISIETEECMVRVVLYCKMFSLSTVFMNSNFHV